jgi:hypothetical protein
MNVEPLVQVGGVRKTIVDTLTKAYKPATLVINLFLVLIIVYGKLVPEQLRKQADTFLGRLFLIVLVITLTIEFGWITGLLAALAVALFLGNPKNNNQFPKASYAIAENFVVKENFGPGSGETTSIKVPKESDNKWLVEKILKENPVAIEEERVETIAVQG